MAARRSVVSSAKLIAICTLISRITGLIRDILLARAFGLGWVQDAFSYAFQFPNLFRRLFGEGAMAPAFVPTFTRTLETGGRDAAWRLLAHTLALLTVTLVLLIIVIAAIIGAIALFPPHDPQLADARRLLLGLTAVMLPFMLFICLLALLSSILNCVGSFVPAALAPVVLNACMIVALAWVGPTVAHRRGYSATDAPGLRTADGGLVSVRQTAKGVFQVERLDAGGARHTASHQGLDALTASDPEAGALFKEHRDRALLTIAYTTAVVVVVAGVLQLIFLYPALRANGVRLGWRWNVRDPTVKRMLQLLPPVALGQGVLAFGVFLDSQICTMLEHVHGTPATAALFGLSFTYPLQEGALSAITYAQRLYQFPLGVLVISLATAALPAFSRLATHGEWPAWTAEVRQSLRLAVFEGVLAGVMMIMLPDALTRLLFERGKFTPADTVRTGYVVACYGFGLWAFCAQHIVLRAFYSLGEVRTPLMISVVLLPVNTALNLVLIWFHGIREAAFAISSSLTASAAVIVGLIILERRVGQRVFDRTTLLALVRMVVAGAAAAAVLALLGPVWSRWTGHIPGRLLARLCETGGLLALGTAVFLAAAWTLRLHELNLLRPRSARKRNA
jgi:murein biosynthesis integral membrane protein MurJ